MGVSSGPYRRTRTTEEFEAAVDRGPTRAPGVSRLLVLCAVLCGLFLMHGAPVGAAGGCHDAMTTAREPSGPLPAEPMEMAAHAAVPTEPSGHAAARYGGGPARAAGDLFSASGESCVFTQSRDRVLPLLLALGLVVLAVRGVTGRRAAVRGPERRGPPFGGRDLLLQVCVART
ncbi:hypothetical protein ACIO87_08575 [Streptomyces sp. NPDC087218]|uniref:hypothetical protein n=1 Tax=Streptomyces sp. NPDC087218 TaxID=3365769 RepID=UPI0037F41AEC